MAAGNGASTGAQRQRAYRERKKKLARSPGIELPPPGYEPTEDEGDDPDIEVSVAQLNARMRRMAMRAFDEAGGVEYLKRVAAKNANTFLRFVGQFVTRDEGVDPAAFTFVVQQINVQAGPVAGVIASPVLAHVSNETPYLPGPGEVIDADVITGGGNDA